MRSNAENDGLPDRAKRGASFVAASLLAAALALVLTGCTSMARPPREPVLTAVEIGTIELRPAALAGTEDLAWQGFDSVLARHADVALLRFAAEEQIAANLQGLPGAPHLHGTLDMPAALPRDAIGSRAAFRKGELAVARLELVAADGRPVAAASTRLEWDDVRWTTGGPKLRRARRPEAALADAVDRVIQLALRELRRELREEATAGGSDFQAPTLSVQEVTP
jgi:hypothetical protein